MRLCLTTGFHGLFVDESHPTQIAAGLRELVAKCGTDKGAIYGGSDGNKQVGEWESEEVTVENLRPNAYVLKWKMNNSWQCWFVGLHGMLRVI